MKPVISIITDDWIKQNNPCQAALNLWDKNERDLIKILKWLIKIDRYDWANWLIVRIMTYSDYVSYAIFAAEQVIHLYEKKYPDDKRPQKAIEAAKKCIKSPNDKNKRATAEAARAATWATAGAAAEAARAATWAAAEAATEAAAWAAGAAAWAAGAAAEAAGAALRKKILEYGLKLLERR